MSEWLWSWSDASARELLGFAAFGILLLGVDDLLADAAWLLTRGRRRRTVAQIRSAPEGAASLAVLVQAWDEAGVIGNMLRHTLRQWPTEPVKILVGIYPNDPATRGEVSAVAATDDRVVPIIVSSDGPTTKADCLNHLWR